MNLGRSLSSSPMQERGRVHFHHDTSSPQCLQLAASVPTVMRLRRDKVARLLMKTVREMVRVFLISVSTLFVDSRHVSKNKSQLLALIRRFSSSPFLSRHNPVWIDFTFLLWHFYTCRYIVQSRWCSHRRKLCPTYFPLRDGIFVDLYQHTHGNSAD